MTAFNLQASVQNPIKIYGSFTVSSGAVTVDTGLDVISVVQRDDGATPTPNLLDGYFKITLKRGYKHLLGFNIISVSRNANSKVFQTEVIPIATTTDGDLLLNVINIQMYDATKTAVAPNNATKFLFCATIRDSQITNGAGV